MSKENYPAGWKDVTNLLSKKNKATDLGFKCSDGDLSRFAARYRLAKSFIGIDFSGYAKSTTNGYNGLFKVFLWYSTIEMLRLCINGKDDKSRNIKPLEIEKNTDKELSDKIRKLDKNVFFNFILEKLDNERLKKELEEFISQKNNQPLIPVKAIRHIFIHGHLTPNAKGTLPATTVKISNILSDYLMKIIDDGFNTVCKDNKKNIYKFIKN